MPKPFASEAEMCARFIAAVDAETWIFYPETNSWDLLLVRKEDGFQIGVQAKLRMNVAVMNQALEHVSYHSPHYTGPDCRAVLVPEGQHWEWRSIAAFIGITIIGVSSDKTRDRFSPELPVLSGGRSYANNEWHEWCPANRCVLPAYVPDVVAGAKAPIQLTEWKIKAIKIAVLIEKNGRVTRQDFKHLHLDPRRWLPPQNKWLLKDGAGGYVAGPALPKFSKIHPRVYREIADDFPTWRPSEPGVQSVLL